MENIPSQYLQGFIHSRWLFGISEPSTVDSIYILCDHSACSAIPLLDSSHRHREGHSFRFQAFLLWDRPQLNVQQLQVIGTLPECEISEAPKGKSQNRPLPQHQKFDYIPNSRSRNKYLRPTEQFTRLVFWIEPGPPPKNLPRNWNI